jgi:Beta-lactamase
VQEAESIKDLAAFLEQLTADDRFSGAVLVANNGSPLFKQAYGLASKVFNVPNRIDTKFNLASMNKMFTGIAIAQLAEQGRLSFSDTIEKYMPEYPKAIAEKVTIHHLLTHTSGMGSYWNDRFDATWATLRTVQDFLSLFIDDPLAFEPGEHTNIVLTGKVNLPEPQKTPTSYAYGFFDETINGHRVVGHSGGASGINSRLHMYLDLGYTVVVLSNYDPPAATQVTDWLGDIL